MSLTPEQRKKSIAAASGAGLLAIAAALTQLQHGGPVDCSLKAQCMRLLESARSENACLQSFPKGEPKREDLDKAAKCVAAIDQGYQETVGACPALDVPKCAPFTHPELGFLR
jgi:hypothetical protein